MGLLSGLMNIRNCAQCGRVFTPSHGEKICRDCAQKAKEFEETVLRYIRENPGSSMKQVMEATGATDKMLKRMIQDGLFSNVTTPGENATYPCMSCGRPITKGTYCSDCLSRLRDQTKRAAEAMKIRVKEDPTMSTIEKLNAQAEKEFERESRMSGIKRNFSKGMFKNR